MNNERWEYHVRQSPSPLTEEQLNELGANGWELAAAMPTAGHYIFKRISPDSRDRATPAQHEEPARKREESETE